MIVSWPPQSRQPSQYWVFWDTSWPWHANVDNWWRILTSRGTGGGGCVCGWQQPVIEWLWPQGFWHSVLWEGHLKTCPLERDEQGHTIKDDHGEYVRRPA